MSQIDLSQLPPPEVVQQLSANFVHDRMLKRYAELQGVEVPKVGDPLFNSFSAMAEEVTRARQEFQDMSLENMVAFASGNNLVHLGAARPVEKNAKETNDQYRRRVQMAPESFSVAGPDGAYIFHALNAHEDVLDASVLSPTPIKVDLYVLSRIGDGTASAELCQTVFNTLDGQTKRPLGDDLDVYSGTINRYRIEVALHMPIGPGEAQTLAIAEKRLQKLADDTHVLGGEVALSAIYAAAHVKKDDKGEDIGSFQPVTKVDLVEPLDGIVCAKSAAPYCYEVVVRKAEVSA